MNELVMIVGMMLVTFLPRYGVLALMGRIDMPKPLFNALKFVPPAVLSAIILPTMVFKDDKLAIEPTNSALVAGIIAGLVAWRTRNLLLTIVVGMAALFIWRAVVEGSVFEPETGSAGLLRELEQTQMQALARLTDADPLTVIYTDGGWRVQDILAHLTAWEEEVARSLNAHHLGGTYCIPNFKLHEFNDAQYQAHKTLPARQVYSDWIETRRRLGSVVVLLTPEQLAAQMTYPSGRKGNCESLIHEVMEHQTEHIEDILHALGR